VSDITSIRELDKSHLFVAAVAGIQAMNSCSQPENNAWLRHNQKLPEIR